MLEKEIFNAKILIVDDQKLHVELLKDILLKAGYQNIETTTDPQEAVEMYRDMNPDIVLLDLIMPKIDGFSVLAQLKELASDEQLPILVLSPEKGQDVRLRALEAGATDFISKPYEGIEVLVRIRNIIIGHLLHNEVRNQNKILEQKVQERTKELSQTRLDIIRRLAKAAEFRDEDTGIHIIRMSKLCALIGAQMGMDSHQCDLLLNASSLHDIGKLGIPDNILLKPGKLDAQEWEIMKTHAKIGADLLSGSDSDLMKMAETIALTHHERWDGTGYPQGLKKEEIPLVGRITAVCDMFDALMSNRPYKKAWSLSETLKEIDRCSNTHFDPKVVEIFTEVISKSNEFLKEYVDENKS